MRNNAADRKQHFSLLLAPLALVALCGWWPTAYGGGNMPAPEITGQTWINAAATRLAELRGKVILVEFWTFGCFNCRNVEPHVKAWHQKYAEQGLVVIGVHTPETDFERYSKNVEHYVREEHIPYTVVTDNDFATWNRYGNKAWPTVHLIDKQGFIRYTHIGEGSYSQTEQQIQALLAER
jgi:thiol-disulfide isomerase/thioredoxin